MDSYCSEIRMMAFDYPPRGWAFCDGQELPIAQNQALFSLLGTSYGGDGQRTFRLPDLRGRVPVHRSDQQLIGTTGGGPGEAMQAASGPSVQTQPCLTVSFCIALGTAYPEEPGRWGR